DYPKDKTIHRLFEEQAKKTPETIAITDKTPDGGTRNLTYRRLNEQAGGIAGLLREKGAGTGTIVAVLMERTIEIVAGLLGVLKTGAAYLPIDPQSPRERIKYMLKDSNTPILLTTPDLEEKAAFKKEVMHPAKIGPALPPINTGRTHAAHLPDIAYVIYTSGTTGRPKGVLIGHDGFVNLIYCHHRIYDEGPQMRISQVANPAFDAMSAETWLPDCGSHTIYRRK
ncbi:MAG: AMP-binding protein, partial [bacterium]|nr:AMP-binding protein [bacterium]